MFGWFKSKKASKEAQLEWETYRGFRIAPTPSAEGGQYRVGGKIEKGEGEATRSYSFVRADLIPSKDEADSISLMKAKLMVDQLGDGLFDEA